MAQAENTTAEPTRRDMIFIATGAMAAVGGVALAVPFVRQLAPNAQTVAAGAPVEVDLAPISEGQAIRLFWRGRLIFVRHRTRAEIEQAQNVQLAQLPDPQSDAARVKSGREQFLVVYGNCTHLGCVPLGNAPGDQRGEYNGWFCPCHGSHYDTSGRIRKGPAPSNLPIPPYEFVADARIRIG